MIVPQVLVILSKIVLLIEMYPPKSLEMSIMAL